MPALRTARTERLELVAPAGVRLHVDDRVWPTGEPLSDATRLKVRCRAGAATMIGVGGLST
jgi:hypothetical protein